MWSSTKRCRAATAGGTGRFTRCLCIEPLEDRRPLAVITVNSLLDNYDPDAPSLDGSVTLREAILAANADAAVGDAPAGNGADELQFDPSLFAAGPATIDAAFRASLASAFVISDDLTITGPGANLLTIDVSGLDPTPDSTLDDGVSTNDGDGRSSVSCFTGDRHVA